MAVPPQAAAAALRVPSLLLWRRVLDEARELTLWERIRRAVSLVVTVARRAGAGAGGRRGPGRAARRRPSRGRVADRARLVVVDAGPDAGGETRWERAVAEARALARRRRRRGGRAGDDRRRPGRGADDRPGADRDGARPARARRAAKARRGRGSPAPTRCTSSPTARVARPLDAGRRRPLRLRAGAERRHHRVRAPARRRRATARRRLSRGRQLRDDAAGGARVARARRR